MTDVLNELFKLKTDLDDTRTRAADFEAENKKLAGVAQERDLAKQAEAAATQDAKLARAETALALQAKSVAEHDLEAVTAQLRASVAAHAEAASSSDAHKANHAQADAAHSAAQEEVTALKQELDIARSKVKEAQPHVDFANQVRSALSGVE